MAVRVFDIAHAPEIEPGERKRILFNSDAFHVWIHGDWPGFEGHMHKHTADELFYCVRGACRFHFPDGAHHDLTPGTMVVIPKGEPYRIENTGGEYLALFGTRAEPDGMERWDAAGRPAASDTEGGRRHRAQRPRVKGRFTK